jgi:CheY-like chemotaxis protein/anti-sigma regulatory factor (Ser/Thr protein kinase)
MAVCMPATPALTADVARKELDELKGTFLASLNHEIRTPLSGILGMADLLLETELTDEQRDYVTTTRLCAEDLFHILNATLEYSALEAGQLTIEETEFSPKEIVDSAIAQQAGKAQAKGLRLSSKVDAVLPETLVGDAARIQEILAHLLDNAIKFTHHGSIELSLSIERSPDHPGHLTVSVLDTGIGIPADRRGLIFESFRQGDGGLARPYPGLGLGLALVRKLVSLMKGDIQVQSEPGQGSKFTAHIPVRLPAERPAVEKPAGERPLTLAVEDNPVGLLVLRHALERHAVPVDTAADGSAALEAAGKRRYQLILMDLQMPGMDGFETTAAIRKLPGYATVPIIALTANFSDEIRRRCQEQGMQGFISKPVEPGRLWETISRYLIRDASAQS